MNNKVDGSENRGNRLYLSQEKMAQKAEILMCSLKF